MQAIHPGVYFQFSALVKSVQGKFGVVVGLNVTNTEKRNFLGKP